MYTCPSISSILYFITAACLAAYFSFSAIRGSYGVLRKVQISAEAKELAQEHEKLRHEIEKIENLTRRLSDRYMDLDLLDQQLRDVLSYIRADEISIR